MDKHVVELPLTEDVEPGFLALTDTERKMLLEDLQTALLNRVKTWARIKAHETAMPEAADYPLQIC